MKTASPLVTLVAALVGALAAPPGHTGELPQPPAVRSENGLLDARLELRNGTVSIAGRRLTFGQYEGSTPGPTWRVKPGDLLKIHLVNRLALPGAPAPETVREVCDGAPPPPVAEPAEGGEGDAPPLDLVTNLHFQGLQVPPGRRGDDPWLPLAPGEACRYEVRIPPDQPPGLYAYLPGFAGSGAKQRWQGLGGAIVVEGALDEVPEVAAAGERLLLLQELWVDRSGAVPEGEPVPAAGDTPFTTVPAAPGNFYFPVNGVLQPTLTLRPGETQRWRLLAAGPHRTFHLRLDGHTLQLLAQDGSALESARTLESLLLAPGNRAEVMVKGGVAGTYWLRALAYEQGHPGGPLPELRLVKVVVAGAPVGGETEGRPARRLVLGRGSIYGVPVAARRTVVCGAGPKLAPLPGLGAEAERAQAITVRAGDVEEWTLVNRDAVQHPFHLPGSPFQVLRINEAEVRDGAWWDTFPLPPQGEVKIRVRFRPDAAGKTAYHCQAAPFEDALGVEGLGTLEILPARSAGALALLALAPPRPAETAAPDEPPAAGATAAGAPAPAEEGAPAVSNLYVFTSAHNGRRQLVEVGTRLQIQLPGEPGVWRLHLVGSPAIVAAGPPRVIVNAGRVAGAAGLYLFDFDVHGPAQGVAIQLELLHPGAGTPMSRYKITLDALETQ